jgi:hypothetical protein
LSVALGILSDKKSRSSDESAATEVRGLVFFGRENRFKKRETADGAGSGTKKSTGSDEGSELVDGAGGTIGIVSNIEADLRLSTLFRGDCETELEITVVSAANIGGVDDLDASIEESETNDSFVSAVGVAVEDSLRPQNEKILVFFALWSMAGVASCCFSIKRQPTGISSGTVSGRLFTPASQSDEDPLVIEK